jgi:hypothetical protein
VADYHLGGDEQLVLDVKQDTEGAGVSDKLKALLAIAGKVQRGGKNVLAEDIERARLQGATDLEIHDTVLIAAAFCMCNRYVDGLATWAPQDAERYRQEGARLAQQGYAQSMAGRRRAIGRIGMAHIPRPKGCLGGSSWGRQCPRNRAEQAGFASGPYVSER